MSTTELSHKLHEVISHSPFAPVVRRVSLFGSYLHGNQTQHSDVDLLVEFERPVGYFTVSQFETYMNQAIQKRIDIVTKGALSPYMKDQVVREAKVVYEK